MFIRDEEVFTAEFLDDSSKQIIYAPLRASVFVVDKTFAHKISDIADEEVKEFFEYLSTKGKIDINKVHETQRNEVPNLSISLTNDCNLRCIYCHANAGSLNNEVFTFEHIDTVIDAYFNILDNEYSKVDEIQLSFMGGGEPTIQFDLMSYAIERVKRETKNRNIVLHVVTATNGCYNKTIADYLIKEFTHISFSFDGPAEIQNIHRPFKNGKGTYDISFNNAKYLYYKRKSFSFRSTISKLTIENYKAFVDFFCDHFPNVSVGVEPLSKFGRGQHCEIAPSMEEFHTFMRNVEEYSSGKSIEFKNSSVEKLQLIRTYFCRAVSAPSFNVNPAGELWACARENAPEQFLYGNFDFAQKKLNLDQTKKNSLKSCNVLNFPECSDCISKYHCAGDCPDYRFENLLRCDTTRMLTIKMLNKIINS